MNQDPALHSFFIPFWLFILGIPLLTVGILIIICTCVFYLGKQVFKKDISTLKKKLIEKSVSWSKAKKDILRKLNHVLIFICFLIVWYIGLSLVNLYTGTSVGMIPENNNMFLLYSTVISDPNSITDVLLSLGWFYYLLFFIFYILCLFMLANEFTRKSRFLSFPFNLFSKVYLSKEEQEKYGTYLYFAIGQMFAAFICPPMVYIAILGISSISDLMTSQIGIRLGKKHIAWNQVKTWEGTIAGMITTFVMSFFFVGLFWSIIFSIIFFEIDMLTNKPINVSDNLLIPISLSLLYLFIRYYFNFDYFSIILQWI
ncbi:MAG: hypothetical protein V3V33_15480 [Candidatus Lokiarchaeia archaeon]